MHLGMLRYAWASLIYIYIYMNHIYLRYINQVWNMSSCSLEAAFWFARRAQDSPFFHLLRVAPRAFASRCGHMEPVRPVLPPTRTKIRPPLAHKKKTKFVPKQDVFGSFLAVCRVLGKRSLPLLVAVIITLGRWFIYLFTLCNNRVTFWKPFHVDHSHITVNC